MKQRLTTFIFAGLCAALFITRADAADYAAGFTVDENVSHNDNIQLVKTNKIAIAKNDLSPKLTFGINTETNKAQLDSTFNFNRYDKSEFNSNDQNIALALSHQFESSSVGLNASYFHNTTLTSELLTSGRIGNKADRAEQYTLSPNWSYTLNEINLIQLSGTYTTQNYGNNAYIGYKNTGVELDWIYLINERLKWTTAATYSEYNSDNLTINVPNATFIAASNDGNTYRVPADSFGQQSYSTKMKDKGIQVGLDYQWSEQSQIITRLGRTKDDTTYPIHDLDSVCTNANYLSLPADIRAFTGALCSNVPHSTNLLSTAEIDWTWSSELQQLGLTATKSTQPTSNGYAVDALQLGSNWSYQLSELDKISASVSLVRNRAIDKNNSRQNTSIADRDYGSATLQYQRQLNEYWFVNASFQFSEQKYTQIDSQASSRVYSLGISYKPQQWHWAR